MKFNFLNNSNRVTSGYGHDLESFAFTSRFAPRIAFDNDDGTGGTGNGGGSTTPAPQQQPVPTAINDKGEVETVAGLKNAAKAERERANNLEKQFKQLQESFKGVDAEKYKDFERLQAEAEKASQERETLRQSLETEYSNQVKAIQTELQNEKKARQDLVKRTQIERVFQSAHGRSEAAEDGSSFFDTVFDHANKFLRTNERGELEVIDNHGIKRFSKKDASKSMTPNELFEELKTHVIFGHCFAPANNGKGSGINPNNGRVMPNQQVDTSRMSTAEKLTRARQQLQGM